MWIHIFMRMLIGLLMRMSSVLFASLKLQVRGILCMLRITIRLGVGLRGEGFLLKEKKSLARYGVDGVERWLTITRKLAGMEEKDVDKVNGHIGR